MKSKVVVVLCLVLAVLIGVSFFRPIRREIVQIENKKCPVSGLPVNGIDTYIHNGKKYNLCSEECKEPLSENPKKYLSE